MTGSLLCDLFYLQRGSRKLLGGDARDFMRVPQYVRVRVSSAEQVVQACRKVPTIDDSCRIILPYVVSIAFLLAIFSPHEKKPSYNHIPTKSASATEEKGVSAETHQIQLIYIDTTYARKFQKFVGKTW